MDHIVPATEHATTDLAADAATLAAVVLQLLEAAEAAVERDKFAARGCLARAAALLRAGTATRGLPVLRAGATPHGVLPRWQADRIAAYVEAHLDGPISAADLIGQTPLSASHFFRTFKATFGQTPLAYIGARRIERAKALMLSSDESLAQIALACGLCDQSHLNRLFRRGVGISPWCWRRENARRGPERAGGRS